MSNWSQVIQTLFLLLSNLIFPPKRLQLEENTEIDSQTGSVRFPIFVPNFILIFLQKKWRQKTRRIIIGHRHYSQTGSLHFSSFLPTPILIFPPKKIKMKISWNHRLVTRHWICCHSQLQPQWCRKVKNVGVPVVIGGDNLPSPVGIGLTDMPNIGGLVALLAPPIPASLPWQ